MCPTSNTCMHSHTGARRHPFPLPTIKVKVEIGGVDGVLCGEREWGGRKLYQEKAVTFPFAGK